jgi:hypothetical protein
MSSQSLNVYPVFIKHLGDLTEAVELYLDWASSPGDDDCPPELIDQLCAAQEEARALLDGLGYGSEPN